MNDLSKYGITTYPMSQGAPFLCAFYGGVLSNFYPARFEDNFITFASSEQHFMYSKAIFFNDAETARKILKTSSPAEAKILGRKVKNYDDAEWDEVRYLKMFYACSLKFKSSPKLWDILIQTEDSYLVEASPLDKIWGCGLSINDPRIVNKDKWSGKNLLGNVLMDVRLEIEGMIEFPF